jgi:hypothetical protein
MGSLLCNCCTEHAADWLQSPLVYLLVAAISIVVVHRLVAWRVSR